MGESVTARCVSNGFNLEDDAAASCGFSTASGDLALGTAPNLGALADNGGPTETQLPQPGSPLIDSVPAASCQADGAAGVTTDQRGVARPQGAACDTAAVEVQTPGGGQGAEGGSLQRRGRHLRLARSRSRHNSPGELRGTEAVPLRILFLTGEYPV